MTKEEKLKALQELMKHTDMSAWEGVENYRMLHGGNLPPEESKIDQDRLNESIANNFKEEQIMEIGEWIARRLLENHELIKTIPPMLYAYYKTWLQICEVNRYNDLYEKEFRIKKKK